MTRDGKYMTEEGKGIHCVLGLFRGCYPIILVLHREELSLNDR